MTENTDSKELMKKDDQELSKAEKEKTYASLALNASIYRRKAVLDHGGKQLDSFEKNGQGQELLEKDPAYQLITLYELENSVLLVQGFTEAYRTLVTDLNAQLQVEYKCETPSQKALAHLVAQNFIRTMELQRHIRVNLDAQSYSDLSLKRLAILNKAYEQANSQYLLSLQALQAIHRPPVNVTVKTTTANIAQNQVIQEKYEAKPI